MLASLFSYDTQLKIAMLNNVIEQCITVILFEFLSIPCV